MDYWRYVAKWAAFAAGLAGWSAVSSYHNPGGVGLHLLYVTVVFNLAHVAGLCISGAVGRPPEPHAVEVDANWLMLKHVHKVGEELLSYRHEYPGLVQCVAWRRSPAFDRACRVLASEGGRDGSH